MFVILAMGYRPAPRQGHGRTDYGTVTNTGRDGVEQGEVGVEGPSADAKDRQISYSFR